MQQETKGRPWWSVENRVLVATILASGMAFIDGTAINVALPDMQRSLGATIPQMYWVVNAYNLLLASFILVGGSLGDLFGRRRVYVAGIVIFTAASVACGLAPSVEVLIIMRAIQGFGGALMVPGSLAILPTATFPPERRGMAIGTWSTFSTVTTVLGPMLGGWLAARELWRLIFYINVPLALIALIALIGVPESRNEKAPRRLDLPGTLLITLALAGLSFGFTEGAEFGFSNVIILGALMLGVVAFLVFIYVEERSANPIVPLALFRSRTFSASNALTLLLYAALGGSTFFLPLNLIQIQGYEDAGRALLPFAIMLILMSRWAGGLVVRVGPRLLLTIGPTVAGVGFAWLGLIGQTAGPQDYFATFLPPILILGVGMALTVAPLTIAVMGAVPFESVGIASGINNAAARVANVLAIAILGAFALTTFRGALATSTAGIEMPGTVRTVLMDQAPRLAALEAPTTLPEAAQQAINTAVRNSFLSSFQLVMFISAGMAWISALLAALFVDNRLPVPAPQAQEALAASPPPPANGIPGHSAVEAAVDGTPPVEKPVN